MKIAETQVKDITIGQPAVIDTRLAGGGSNGLINGKVSRIDPSIMNGTVTVDVALEGTLPRGARPDLSVDGTIQLMKLDDVVYVGRPVFGQQDSTVRLFKIDPDGKYANKIKVAFGRSFGEHDRDQERVERGGSRDPLGYVGVRRLRPN